MIDIKKIDVLILCGGLGRRLKSIVSDRPKPMAEIDECPFLDILIDYVASYGFKRFILCVGYKADIIKQYYRKESKPVTILFSEENKPLGTAGAVKNAQKIIKSNPFLVMNGDSFCKINLHQFLNFHLSKRALLSIALVKSKKTAEFGVVKLGDSQQIIEFNEKGKADCSNLINAGIYLFEKEIISQIPENKNYSLEYDLFPRTERCYGYITDGTFVDIGTPEEYKRAKRILQIKKRMTS